MTMSMNQKKSSSSVPFDCLCPTLVVVHKCRNGGKSGRDNSDSQARWLLALSLSRVVVAVKYIPQTLSIVTKFQRKTATLLAYRRRGVETCFWDNKWRLRRPFVYILRPINNSTPGFDNPALVFVFIEYKQKQTKVCNFSATALWEQF